MRPSLKKDLEGMELSELKKVVAKVDDMYAGVHAVFRARTGAKMRPETKKLLKQLSHSKLVEYLEDFALTCDEIREHMKTLKTKAQFQIPKFQTPKFKTPKFKRWRNQWN